MDSNFFQNNRRRLMDRLPDDSITIMFAGQAPTKTGDQAYHFTPNRNFYYLTGIDEENIILLMTKANGTTKEYVFVEKPDPVMARWIGESMTEDEAANASGIETTAYLEDFKKYLQRFLMAHPYKQVNLDLEKRDWDAPDTPAHVFAKDLQSRYPFVQVNNIYHDICELRVFKTPEEIEQIKEASRITIEGIHHLMNNTKPGMTENQAEAYFDFTLKSNGVNDHAFNTICASGKNATVLHYEDNNDVIEDGDLVLLDLGAQWGYYSSDISHTFPANGTFTDRQKAVYDIVLDVLRRTNEKVKPGISIRELNDFAKQELANGCQNLGIIDDPEDISDYYFHSIGHLLGLDTHDVGTSATRPLEPGMVVTIEPGLYIEEESIGVRIEDDILVTEDGYENLTKDLKR
ncbi:aminopeptidase P family protein [Tuberibacillus sp. Marseille-P3662]|uniref:aminopeptidase P family protein n=1 Tax=Tuberibacillus sp. Marseille-P3662 TaxID=1965358 RepID=UPI000A1C9571|nr:aminopeptidase P family protein [Tuberibacillus sp. Marseille-P3662]